MVLELGATAAPAFLTTGEKFSQLLTLTYDPRAAPGALRVEVMPLDCDGVTADKTSLSESDYSGKPGATTASRVVDIVKPEPPIWLVLTATVPSVTTCKGQLRFKVGSLPYQPRPFNVTRTAPVELPVEVSGLQRMASPVGSDNVTFALKGPTERALTVKPALFELGRKGETSAILAKSTMSPEDVQIPKGGGVVDFTLKLEGLGPGEYVGKLNLASEGYKAKLHPFTVAVRLGPELAALIVVLGAGLALGLKRLATRVRPRLVVRSAVSRLLATLLMQRQANVLDPQEFGVLTAIQARVSQVLEEATQAGDPPAGWADKARDLLAAESAKVTAFTQWLNASRLLASITNLDAAKRTAFDLRVIAGRQALTISTPLDSAMVEDLAKLPGDVEEAKAAVAKAAVSAVVSETATAAEATSSLEAAAEFRKAHTHAQQASALLEAKNYSGYRQEYDASGRAYYSGLAAELEGRMAAPPPPAGNGPALAPGLGLPVPDARDSLAQVRSAPDLQAARAAYLKARDAMAAMPQAVAPNALIGAMPPAPLRSDNFADLAVGEQRPLMPELANTVIEDTKELTARTKLLDNVVDGAALVGAAALGVILVWMPNAGWGRPQDLVAAFLWGMGLHTVGTSTFEGILGLRTRLT